MEVVIFFLRYTVNKQFSLMCPNRDLIGFRCILLLEDKPLKLDMFSNTSTSVETENDRSRNGLFRTPFH